MKLTPTIVRNLRLLRAPDFDPLREWIQAEGQEALTQMAVVRDETHWKQLQGRYQFIKELLEYVEASDTLMEKLTRK